jgi:heme/copper-type cytochrome/quinol oxidase subunit 2
MSATDLVTHVVIVGGALLLIAPGLVRRSEVGGLGTSICLIGAAATIVLALLAYAFARSREQDAAPRLSVREWFAQRGFLYMLTQAPIAAIFSGFFFRVLPFAFAVLGAVAAFFVLAMWVSYRKRRSTSADEPIHHLHRYALWALVPCVLFSIARIPTHLGFGFAYWHPWYDFGAELTKLASHHYPSLFTGAMLYTLDGIVLTIGYYVLFQRRSLVNAILYLCLYLSSLYCFTFPAYARIGMPSPPLWHGVVFWAHLVMAVGAWYTPRFFRLTWPRLRWPGRAAALSVIAILIVAPYAYAAVRANDLQWPRQQRIDSETFARKDLLSAPSRIAATTVGEEARYEIAMKFGPRSYKTWVNRTRMLDAERIKIDGKLVHAGRTIAWCAGYVAALDDINEAAVDPDYMARVRAGDHADIPVHCFGPAAAAREIAATDLIEIEWRGEATLIGDRESEVHAFHGTRAAQVIPSRTTR